MREGRWARAPWIVVVLVVLCVGAACGAGDDGASTTSAAVRRASDEGDPEPGGRLVMALNAESTGFNPLIDLFALQSHFVASAVFDPLARVDDRGEAVPYLATDITHNDDATVWTITLPDGVTFHDGTDLDADVVARNLQVRRDGPTGAVQFPLLDQITAVDDRTVEVTMDAPWVAFDDLLTQQPGYIVSQSMLDSYPNPHDPVGTGPFRFDEWIPDQHVLLERNDDYWQEGKPYLDELEFTTMVDPTSQVDALVAGDVDAIFTVDAGSVARLRDLSDVEIVEDGFTEENVIPLNAALEPFDQPSARRAVIQAIDRDVVNATVYEGLVQPADGPFAEREQWYSEDTGYLPYDQDAARAAVAEYEADTGHHIRFTMSVIAGTEGLTLGQLLKEMWSEVGIESDVEVIEQADFIGRLVGGTLQAAHQSNFGYADPDFFYLFMHSSNSFPPGDGISTNFSHTENAALDATLEEGRANPDPDARIAAYQEMVRVLNAQTAYIWLNHRLAAIASRPQINGLTVAESIGFGRVDSKPWLADVWVESGG